MPITSVKVHPSIGIARVGNSPDEFFIGPERPWEVPDPGPGGFKDALCRVKRQGTRFRVFGYDENGDAVEITAAEADITWTVHLCNRKAPGWNPSLPEADMVIDPGPRVLDAPGQSKLFDSGTITFPPHAPVAVPLGEARTDADGRLIVLGGFGRSESPAGVPPWGLWNAEWFDDVSDGPVTATVHLHATGETFAAVGAWVVVGPPKFAPELDSVVTLYDRIYDVAAAAGWITPPATPSYTEHIYPILLHAHQSRWLEQVPMWAHGWGTDAAQPVTNPVTRQTIWDFLKPSGTMPKLNSAELTATQLAWLEAWRDGQVVDDWPGAPPTPPAQVTPDGLDRASLSGALGASFYPGIEVGNFILDAAHYASPFRFDPAVVRPGDVTAGMSLPWQADFNACGDWWWPVPRPNHVFPPGEALRKDWDRGIGNNSAMVNLWHALGFVVRDGSSYVEVGRCFPVTIHLLTPSLLFADVEQGPMGSSVTVSLPIVFEVSSLDSAVTLEFQVHPLNPRLQSSPPSVTVGPTAGGSPATAELWISYETGAPGELVMDEVTIVHAMSGQSFVIPITASTIARKTTAVALVLDRSGSMTEDRGDGEAKIDSLRQAAAIFVDAMLDGDGVAVVRYNHDAQLLQPVTGVGSAADPADPVRLATKALVDGPQMTPAGATSIGDGVFEGRAALQAAEGFTRRAMVVLTDGVENSARWLSEVVGELDERTYAIGFGTPANTSAAALDVIASGTGGQLLVTGEIGSGQEFLLQKFFLQVLAGVTNAEVVLDPAGTLLPGEVHRIPFQLSDLDTTLDVFLLTADPGAVDFRLQTPNGFLLEPWRATSDPRIRYVESRGMAFYRLTLPAELWTARFDQEGTWHVVLTLGSPKTQPPARGVEKEGLEAQADAVRARGAVHSYPYPRAAERPSARLLAGPRTAETERLLRAAALRHASGLRTSSRPSPEGERLVGAEGRSGPLRGALAYSVVVHSYSSASLRCSVSQGSHEPGAPLRIHAALTEAGRPVADAHLRVEVTRPDGSRGRAAVRADDESAFSALYDTSLPGIYTFRVRAAGTTRRGHPFQRERTFTAAVWPGGDLEPPRDRPEGGAGAGGKANGGGAAGGGGGATGGSGTGTSGGGREGTRRGCLGWLLKPRRR